MRGEPIGATDVGGSEPIGGTSCVTESLGPRALLDPVVMALPAPGEVAVIPEPASERCWPRTHTSSSVMVVVMPSLRHQHCSRRAQDPGRPEITRRGEGP